MLTKLKFVAYFLIALPRILFRCAYYPIIKRKTKFYEFRPTNIIGINGTLNQLIWHVDSPLFITINNSHKVFVMNHGEIIFKMDKSSTDFELKAYTLQGVKKHTTKIEIITVKQESFNNIVHRPDKSNLTDQKPKIKEQTSVNAVLSKNGKVGLDTLITNEVTEEDKHNNKALKELLNKIEVATSIEELTDIKQQL